MSNTTSIKFPNMFNVTQNSVMVLEDREAIANRVRLLILTEPTELYNNLNFGVGLKRHLWKYNTPAERGIIRDRIVEQIRLHEPYVIAEETQWADGLMFTGEGDNDPLQKANDVEMTVAVKTIFNDSVNVSLG